MNRCGTDLAGFKKWMAKVINKLNDIPLFNSIINHSFITVFLLIVVIDLSNDWDVSDYNFSQWQSNIRCGQLKVILKNILKIDLTD
jgi:hypothetical protein